MASNITCFTIVARNYLGYAITLGHSLAATNPDHEFSIVVVDGMEGISASDIPFNLVNAADICDSDYLDMAYRYNVVEFATSIKPQIFLHFMQSDDGIVLYLDPDLQIHAPLDEITAGLQGKSICVTPHLLQCKIPDEPYPEYLHLFEGVFNFGFCGVRSSDDARRFLEWWDDRLRKYCYIDHRSGLHTDQKWANYLPCYFVDSLLVLQHPGANVSHWNLGERSVTFENGRYSVNKEPLLFFHFSGFDYHGSGLVKRGKVETRVAEEEVALTRLASQYRSALKLNGHERYSNLSYVFDFYANGDAVTHLHRRLYRESAEKLKDPFRDFYPRLAAANLIDRSALSAAGYRRGAIKGVEKKIERFGFVLKFLLRIVGVEKYTLLIKACNYFGQAENHRFLLSRKDPENS